LGVEEEAPVINGLTPGLALVINGLDEGALNWAGLKADEVSGFYYGLILKADFGA
jgi:hypothetical protein